MKNRHFWFIMVFLALVPAVVGAADAKKRTFLFIYGGAVTGLKPGEAARVWLPVARTNSDQIIEVVDQIVPGQVQGYHCWAKFKPAGHGWMPVDISEAKQDPSRREYYFGRLDENRVMFSSGRDLQLVPRQAGPPVNFLVYPYVEVNGKPYPQEKIRRDFTYRDLEPGSGRVK